MVTPQQVLEELKKVKYPGFARDIVSFGMVKDIEVGSPQPVSSPQSRPGAAAMFC